MTKKIKTYSVIINDHGSVVTLQLDSMTEIYEELISWFESRSSIFGFQIQVVVNDVPTLLGSF